jgi:hypothetical protein
MFEREWQTYRTHKDELLAAAPGEFVVIRGDKILGTYPDTALAFAAGVKAFGPERFFLHRISETEPEAYQPPPFIGMVAAGSTLRYPTPQ